MIATAQRDAAYRQIKPQLSDKCAAVLGVVMMKGPISSQDIADFLGWKINQVTGRVSELRDDYVRIHEVGSRPIGDFKNTLWDVYIDPNDRWQAIREKAEALSHQLACLEKDYHSGMTRYTLDVLQGMIKKKRKQIAKLEKL